MKRTMAAWKKTGAVCQMGPANADFHITTSLFVWRNFRYMQFLLYIYHAVLAFLMITWIEEKIYKILAF